RRRRRHTRPRHHCPRFSRSAHLPHPRRRRGRRSALRHQAEPGRPFVVGRRAYVRPRRNGMKLRNFGALVLAVVGVVPLTAAMVAGVRRSASTALNEVQTGNQRVAERASETLRLYVRSQVELIRTLGNSLSSSMHLSPEQKKRILKNYLISFPHIRTLEVV